MDLEAEMVFQIFMILIGCCVVAVIFAAGYHCGNKDKCDRKARC